MNTKRTFGVQLLSASLFLGIAATAPHASAEIVNPSFEDASYLNGWTVAGDAIFPVQTYWVSPTDGAWQAVINKERGVETLAALAPFLGVSATELASVIGDGDLDDLYDSYGAAIKQHFSLAAPSTLTFDFNLFTVLNGDSPYYPETIVAVLDGQAYFVNDTDAAVFTGNDSISKWAGYSTFAGLPTLSAGEHDIAVAAIGQIQSAGVQVDNFVVTATPEPTSFVLAVVSLAGLGFIA